MKLFYITNTRIPTEKAHGIQIMKMSEVFSRLLGVDNFLLVLPKRVGSRAADNGKIALPVCEQYGIKERFKVQTLPAIDLLKIAGTFLKFLDNLAYFIETSTFGIAAVLFCIHEKPDVIYTRDFLLLPFLLFLGKPVFYEIHLFPTTKIGIIAHQILIPLLTGVVVVNNQFPSVFSKYGISPRRILVSHNATDLGFFQKIDLAQVQKLRETLNLKKDNIVVGYIGRLSGAGQDKGKQILLSAMTLVAKKNHLARFLIVGEKSEDLSSFSRVVPRKLRNRFIFTGVVEYRYMPLYFALLDIGVIPFPDKPHFRYFMSPLKLFDYLAAGKPIVSCDLPPIREILTEENAIFARPGSTEELAAAITKLVKDEELQKKLKTNNLILSRNYTWVKRTKRILKFIFR